MAIKMVGPSFVVRRTEKKLSPSADEATLPSVFPELTSYLSVMAATGRIGSR
jgi:hypothetical protein